MYKTLSKLINKKFYRSKEEAVSKCDACFAMNRITESQYSDLLALIDEVYGTDEETESIDE